MAITVTTLHDGPRNAVVHVSIVGDGSGDLADEVLVDPAAFDPPLPARPALKISKIMYDFTGFNAYLEFDYLSSDTPIWSMSGDQPGCFDFDSLGGLTDRSNELDGSGKLQITTDGLAAGDRGSMVLWVRKS
jgi:hypothetical protein